MLMITSEWPSKEFPYAGKFVFDQAESLRKEGIDLDIYFFRGNKNPFIYIKHFVKVWKICRKKSYNLIHCQFGQSGLMTLLLNLPLVVTFRGTDLNGYKNSSGIEPIKSKVLRLISKIVAYKATQVIVVSKKLAEKLPKNIKYIILPSGIDMNLFKPLNKLECREKLNLPLDEKIIFFPSDPDRVVKRFELANNVFLRYQETNYQSVLMTASNIPNSEMVYYYNASDVVLFTSSNEGSPNVIKEAMACNVPILTVDVGDVSEYVELAKGNVISKNDLDSLADNLKKMLKSGLLVSSRSIVEKYSRDFITHQLIEIYKAVCSSRLNI